ncbi:pyridoxal phosphate-dependent transferase [Terfezia claveryi]|nr:pyridoxal phosphate-dependent transferase [Terfezia claveryi]
MVEGTTHSERQSSPHIRFREADALDRFHERDPGIQFHKSHGLDPNRASTEVHNSAHIGTHTSGVVWTTERAYEHGYMDHPEEWGNLGQGAPEVEDIPGSFHRPQTIDISINSREYGPTGGIKSLREAVAHLYNTEHREGWDSKYTWENVCIVPGGRSGLIRIAAVIGNIFLAYFVPDYTAYNEMLGIFKNFVAVPVPLEEKNHYWIVPELVKKEVQRGVSAILTSNPRNPTGIVVKDEKLKEIQDICRGKATLVMDEFYSGYYYGSNCDGTTISAAVNVTDVNSDDVLILDGLTKRFRLPGWRIAWILGPKALITALSSCGSYLDGGANVPFQVEAVKLLKPELVRHEMSVLQRHFKDKRDYVLQRLEDMGFELAYIPDSTFYLWLDLSLLPPKIHHGLGFFQECLKEKVLVVPGIFFDINPSRRRELFDSPCHHFVRLSYGPRMDLLEKGLDAMERVLRKNGFVKKIRGTEANEIFQDVYFSSYTAYPEDSSFS